MQGVTELSQCERCDDAWLLSVQAEFRRGSLQVDTHAFLHGEDTQVPGSWVEGRATCGTLSCQNIGDTAVAGSVGNVKEWSLTPAQTA